VGAFCVISYLGWAMLIHPVEIKIASVSTDLDAAKQKLEDAKSKATQYDKFRAQAENVRRDLNLITQRLDPDLSLREKGRIVDRIMTGSGLRDWKITTDPNQKRQASTIPGFTSLDQIQMKYDFKGGFDDLGDICNRIVSNERILCPESLEIAADGKDSYYDPTVDVTNFVVSFFVEPAVGAAK
jgi:Tfp pilus assembly protein PilO